MIFLKIGKLYAGICYTFKIVSNIQHCKHGISIISKALLMNILLIGSNITVSEEVSR